MNMNLRKFAGALRLGVISTVLGGATLLSAGRANAAVVINEVYGGGGGGTTGTLYKYDFIELYNNGTTTETLSGYALQYGSAATTTGNLSNVSALPATVTIPAGGYYLIKEGNAGTVGADFTADTTGTLNLGAMAGKVALTSSTAAVPANSATGATIVDFVGYGTSATPFEGTAPTANLSVTTSASRTNGVDTNNNGADFTVGTPSPTNASGTTPTATPVPTATSTPIPGATSTPTPVPTATATPIPVGPPSTTLVVSEIYGGGGNANATYTNDFIEIYNLGSTPVDLSNYSVQYSNATATTAFAVTPLNGTIAPGSYYLIQEASQAAVGAALPTANATGNINLSATAGRVALVSSTTAITGPSSTGVIDFVGYGATAIQSESSPATAPSGSTVNSTSITRTNPATDTNNNANDFSVATPSPTAAVTAAPLKISEFRFSGPGASPNLNEYIELANQTSSAVTLTGYTLTAGSAPTALSGLDLTGKVIPAFGHLLITNSGGYSLGTVYPSTYPVGSTTPSAFATGDVVYTGDISIDSTLTLSFNGTVVDTVGNLSTTTGLVLTDEYAFVRRQDGPSLVDTGNDINDFNLVDISSTNGPPTVDGLSTSANGARLGTPGPQNASSPLARAAISIVPLDPATNQGIVPDGRYPSRGSNLDPFGRLTLRRTITNNTSQPIKQIRFILVRTTAGASSDTNVADLRAITSVGVSANGSKVVQAIQIEAPTTPTTPSNQLSSSDTGNGGGLNSSWNVGTLPAGGLAAGASMNVEFVFGIVRLGNYNISVVIQVSS